MKLSVVCYKETAKAYSKSQQGVWRRKEKGKREKSLSEATTKNQFPIS
jgi:hypothetical protein